MTGPAASPRPALPADLRGKRAVVMGLGLFSGGVETARWLVGRGARVVVTDVKDAAALAPSVEALAGLEVEFRLGGHDPADFDGADLVVASPAVPLDHPLLARAAAAGAVLDTEVNLFLAACPARVTGITGSNGKSTTAALLGAVLEAAGRRVHLGGNIGRALLNRTAEMAPGDEVVLELSSFQLEWTARAGRRPAVAVITNVTPNHLDRHGTFEAYLEAKAGILPEAGEGRAVIADRDDGGARSLGERAAVRRVWTGIGAPVAGESVRWEGERLVARLEGGEEEILRREDVGLRGEFNLRNVAGAAAAARVLGVPAAAIRAGTRGFRGLPHRLEPCGEVRGVLCVNDSKATTPEAALRAVGVFDRPVVIAGGHDKKVDLAPFAEGLARGARAVVLLGATAERLEGLLRAAGARQVRRAADMEEAVALGLGLAAPSGVLLLSPGHASYGMFAHYEERGDRFRVAVKNGGTAGPRPGAGVPGEGHDTGESPRRDG